MAGEIDAEGTRKEGLDAFLAEKVAEGFTVETRTDTHAIVFRRPKGLRRFTSGKDPGRSWSRSTRTAARPCVRPSRGAPDQDCTNSSRLPNGSLA